MYYSSRINIHLNFISKFISLQILVFKETNLKTVYQNLNIKIYGVLTCNI